MSLVDYVVLYYLRNFDKVRRRESKFSELYSAEALLLGSQMFLMSAAMFPACWHRQERVPSAGASGFLAGFSGEV